MDTKSSFQKEKKLIKNIDEQAFFLIVGICTDKGQTDNRMKYEMASVKQQAFILRTEHWAAQFA